MSFSCHIPTVVQSKGWLSGVLMVNEANINNCKSTEALYNRRKHLDKNKIFLRIKYNVFLNKNLLEFLKNMNQVQLWNQLILNRR